jgi:uncharacterized membrane protein YhaH (DUF805 family)
MGILEGLYIAGCWIICIVASIRAVIAITARAFKEAAISGFIAAVLFLLLI